MSLVVWGMGLMTAFSASAWVARAKRGMLGGEEEYEAAGCVCRSCSFSCCCCRACRCWRLLLRYCWADREEGEGWEAVATIDVCASCCGVVVVGKARRGAVTTSRSQVRSGSSVSGHEERGSSALCCF